MALWKCFLFYRFNDYNGSRPSESLSQGTSSTSTNTPDNTTELYAKSPETGAPKVTRTSDGSSLLCASYF